MPHEIPGQLSFCASQFPTAAKQDHFVNIGIAADHGGWALKSELEIRLRRAGHEVVDYGAKEFDPADDYPDFVIPMAEAVARGALERGLALCGSGVGASIAANKVHGIRAALIHDAFSARQGVEDDNMNVLSLGGKVIKLEAAMELVTIFLASRFSGAVRHRRRLAKVMALESLFPASQALGPEHTP